MKVLLALTSYHGDFYEDGAKTGVFVVEALHPFNEYKKQGYEVQFVSETGKFGWDEHSLSNDFLTGQDRTDFEDPESDFNKALKNIKAASEIKDGKAYDIFFASAGHGSLFDYPNAKGLQHLALEIYEKGGVFAAVCHGPAIFDNLIVPSTNKALIEGKKITGFTDIGEVQLNVDDAMKKRKLLTIREVAEKYNAQYQEPNGPWDDFTVVDGKLVTGVNPQSAYSTAKKSVEALKTSN